MGKSQEGQWLYEGRFTSGEVLQFERCLMMSIHKPLGKNGATSGAGATLAIKCHFFFRGVR